MAEADGPPQAPPGAERPERADRIVAKRRALVRGWLAIDVAVVVALVGLLLSGPWLWVAVLLAAAALGYALVQGVAWRRAVIALLDP